MTWNEVLAFFGVDGTGKSKAEVKRLVQKSHRKLALLHHPDRGGSNVEFLRVQSAYDTFKILITTEFTPTHESAEPVGEGRHPEELFFLFREYLLKPVQKWTFKFESVCEALRVTPDEKKWVRQFCELAEKAGFTTPLPYAWYEDHSMKWSVIYFPDGITMARFYRMYAIRCLPRDSTEFRLIEQMYVSRLPLRFVRF